MPRGPTPYPSRTNTSSSMKSNSNNTTPAPSIRPGHIERRDSLASLSVANDWRRSDGDKTWPDDWRAYLALVGGFLLMFNSWGLVNAYGTYSSYYVDHLFPGIDLLKLNLVGSTESFWVLIMSAIVGRLLDARQIRALLVTGTVLVSLGTFLLSVVNGDGGDGAGNYGLIWLVQGTLQGLGSACFFVSSSWVAATWFKKKKGLAVGIVASGASIAGLVYPMMLRFLLKVVTFNHAQRYVATLTTVTAAIAVLIAQPNPEQHYRIPERWSVRDFLDKDAFKNAAYVWFVAAICFLFLSFYPVFFNLEEWAAATGIGYRAGMSGENANVDVQAGALQTYLLLSIMNATSTVGRISSAWLCDHFGPLNVHCAVTFIASLLILILWTLSKSVASAIAFVIVFGIFSGAVIGLPPASVADILGIYDRKAQTKLGQWTGMMYSSAAIFALTGPVIGGHLVSEYGTFLAVQCWSGACMFVSALCMAVSIYFKRRNEKRARVRDEEERLTRVVTSVLSTSGSRRESEEKEKEDV